MTLSPQVWQQSLEIIQASVQHNFNLELAAGSLPPNIFAYYLEQDIYFVRDFGKCLKHISTRVKSEYFDLFSQFVKGCEFAATDLKAKFIPEKGQYQKTGLLTPATVSLHNYFLDTCSNQPVEIAIAAILPCFWVYREVGIKVAQNSVNNNLYSDWISKYTSVTYAQSVDQVIQVFDEYASMTNFEIREGMMKAFETSSALELSFWDDAYNQKVIDITDVPCTFHYE